MPQIDDMATRFQREASGEFAITAASATSVSIGTSVYASSVHVSHNQPPQAWPVTCFAELSSAALSQAVAPGIEIVLIGTGPALRFPRPDVLRPLIDARIGYEVMSTDAACRTYNLLLAEGRAVVALLLIETGDAANRG